MASSASNGAASSYALANSRRRGRPRRSGSRSSFSPAPESHRKLPSRSSSRTRTSVLRPVPPVAPAPAVVPARSTQQKALAKQRNVPPTSPPPSLHRRPTPLLAAAPPPAPHTQRWHLRSMWELASVINFFNVFRPVLKLSMEFSFEELESGLISPNAMLESVHISLLKGIPPVSRIQISRDLWVTALSKKLKNWWPWVAEGPFPLAPNHGEELATYKELDPEVRLLILKALCEVRLDQDDIRAYIDDAIRKGTLLATFQKERFGVDMLGSTYWYENDPIAGQRLYRELRNFESREKPKGRGHTVPPTYPYTWETLATNLDEFNNIAEKLSSSRNKWEATVAKKISSDILPELELLQKKKEKTLKKQQRQALLLDSALINAANLTGGRSKRQRKPVTYTFDDFDRSINEAINLTTKPGTSPETAAVNDTKAIKKDVEHLASDSHGNENHSGGSSKVKAEDQSCSVSSGSAVEMESERSRRQRKPQIHLEHYFEGSSDQGDADSQHSTDGEGSSDAGRKKRRKSSSINSDDDDEYCVDEDEDDEEVNDEDDSSTLGFSDDDGGDGQKYSRRVNARGRGRGRVRGRGRRKMFSSKYDDEDDSDGFASSDDERYMQKHAQPSHSRSTRNTRRSRFSSNDSPEGLRRSKRATRSNINYSRYEDSDSEKDLKRATRSNVNHVNDDEDSDSEKDLKIATRSNVDHGKYDEDSDSEEEEDLKRASRSKIDHGKYADSDSAKDDLKRATRSKVDYSKYEDSGSESEDHKGAAKSKANYSRYEDSGSESENNTDEEESHHSKDGMEEEVKKANVEEIFGNGGESYDSIVGQNTTQIHASNQTEPDILKEMPDSNDEQKLPMAAHSFHAQSRTYKEQGRLIDLNLAVSEGGMLDDDDDDDNYDEEIISRTNL